MGLLDVFQRVYKTGQAEEFATQKYKDHRISLWVANYVFKLHSGEIVAIYNDITKQKQLDEELEKIGRASCRERV